MTQDRVPTHWIRENAVTRIPRRHIIVDTEAHEIDDGATKTQTFRLACGAFDHQTKAGRPWRPTERQRFTSPRALWEWVDSCTIKRRRTVLVAHNLAYDLRVGRALTELPALGWDLEMIRLDGGSAWAQWHSGDRSLAMVDTVSWFGVGLDRIGQLLGMTKPALPDWADDDESWFARCEADVEILRTAWRRVLDWILTDDLGNWKPTGAGQGWAMFRHRHMTHRILHHDHAPIAAIEREASHTGRCEAWRWGKLPVGEWSEWDFSSAYAHVAADCEVPTRLLGHLGPGTANRALAGGAAGASLIRCRVATETPTAPYRRSGGILWPVGRFTSWLWDHEAREAIANGAEIEAIEGWRYASAPALQQWARWVLDRVNADADSFHPLLRLIVKGWSRTTVGRFGAQWSQWDRFGASVGSDCSLWTLGNGDTGQHRRLMMVGGTAFAEGERTDAPDGAVHVMSWIMAECRVRLWRAMQTAGLANVAYVDTDGLICNADGSDALRAAALPGFRLKGSWRRAEILGPRQLVLGDQLRAAGIPKAAVRVGARKWDAQVWRSLPASLRAGELDRVVIRDRAFTLRGIDRRRLHVAHGATEAVRVIEW